MSVRNRRFSLFGGYTETIAADFVEVPQGLDAILPADVSISVIRYDEDTVFYDSFQDGVVVSSIMSLSVEELVGRTFSPPVTLQFDVSGATTTVNTTFTCSYYDFTVKGWASKGCVLDEAASTSTLITCKCSHLTNFAVLLDSQGLADSALSKTDKVALEYITTIGLSISVILMGLAVLFFLWHRV